MYMHLTNYVAYRWPSFDNTGGGGGELKISKVQKKTVITCDAGDGEAKKVGWTMNDPFVRLALTFFTASHCRQPASGLEKRTVFFISCSGGQDFFLDCFYIFGFIFGGFNLSNDISGVLGTFSSRTGFSSVLLFVFSVLYTKLCLL